MTSLIAKLFGLTIPTWVIELVALLALSATGVLYLEHRGATHELQKLEVSSAKLLTSTKQQIAAEVKAHAADVAANQEKLNEALDSNAALQSQLDQRVRDFDAYRRAHAPVARAPSQPAAAASGECGAQSCGDLAERLAERGNELATSIGELRAGLQACERDRDSLTGLPE